MVYDPETGNALILGISRYTEPREVVQYSYKPSPPIPKPSPPAPKPSYNSSRSTYSSPNVNIDNNWANFFFFNIISLIIVIVISRTNRMIIFCGESISICFIAAQILVFIVTTCLMKGNDHDLCIHLIIVNLFFPIISFIVYLLSGYFNFR